MACASRVKRGGAELGVFTLASPALAGCSRPAMLPFEHFDSGKVYRENFGAYRQPAAAGQE